jgi:hypothetical protein
MSNDANYSSSIVINDKILITKIVYIALSNPWKNLKGVKVGTIFTKWGNLDENLLNGVIAVKIVKLGGKN